MWLTVKKIAKFKKRNLYLVVNFFLLGIILALVSLYFFKSTTYKIKEVRAEEDQLTKQDYPHSNSSTTSSTTLESLSSSTNTPEEIIDKLKENLSTNDAKNPNLNFKKGEYVKIIDSCNSAYQGDCVRARTCPSLTCPKALSLRNEMVFKTDGKTIQADELTWYHLVFDEWIRYGDRLPKDLYVASQFLTPIESYKANYPAGTKVKNLTDKKIIVNLTKQKLYAYNGEELFMEVSISSGLDDLPTPRGTFHIFEKTPSRYMQGPLPNISEQYYDLPGVPWTMYFTYQGGAIHGAYWHNNFGEQWSHGCVNLRPEDAELLYKWADLGTTVTVKD